MRKNDKAKPWPKMSSAELARATRAFDDPNFVPPTVQEPAEQARRHRQAMSALRSKTRATRNSDGAEIRVRLERTLLRRADALASAKGVNRSRIVADGLELMLSKK